MTQEYAAGTLQSSGGAASPKAAPHSGRWHNSRGSESGDGWGTATSRQRRTNAVDLAAAIATIIAVASMLMQPHPAAAEHITVFSGTYHIGDEACDPSNPIGSCFRDDCAARGTSGTWRFDLTNLRGSPIAYARLLISAADVFRGNSSCAGDYVEVNGIRVGKLPASENCSVATFEVDVSTQVRLGTNLIQIRGAKAGCDEIAVKEISLSYTYAANNQFNMPVADLAYENASCRVYAVDGSCERSEILRENLSDIMAREASSSVIEGLIAGFGTRGLVLGIISGWLEYEFEKLDPLRLTVVTNPHPQPQGGRPPLAYFVLLDYVGAGVTNDYVSQIVRPLEVRLAAYNGTNQFARAQLLSASELQNLSPTRSYVIVPRVHLSTEEIPDEDIRRGALFTVSAEVVWRTTLRVTYGRWDHGYVFNGIREHFRWGSGAGAVDR